MTETIRNKRKYRMRRGAAAFLLAMSLSFTACGETETAATAGASENVTESAAESISGSVEESTSAYTSSTASDSITESVSADTSGGAGENMTGSSSEGAAGSSEEFLVTDSLEDAPEIGDLTCEGQLDLTYAQRFRVYYYEDRYKLFVVLDNNGAETDYLLIPEDQEIPEGLSEDIVTLQAPLDHIYMAASGSMCFFSAIDSLQQVTLTAIDEDGWTLEEPVEALQSGEMTYAGKYSEPDYELLLDSGCDVAIESTMILHAPEVQEMLEDLGIPVVIDRCSYETDPFGRMEWVKFYGALMGKEQEAADYFDKELESLGDYENYSDTGKTAAFFAINSSGQVTVRKSDDFIPNLMDMAGGHYIFEDLENPAGDSASVNMTMEEFYHVAKDADYLIYNATIESPLSGVDDLLSKSELFEDFRAVKNGNVWQVDKSWYQSTDRVGNLLTDFHHMFTGGSEDDMTFLTHVE